MRNEKFYLLVYELEVLMSASQGEIKIWSLAT